MKLLLIAFLEGFVTLAVELIAIRLSVPIVGSSMVLTGVMLGVILLSLSAGYWSAGKLCARLKPEEIPQQLQKNFLYAALFYLLVTFPLHDLVMATSLGLTRSITWSILITSLLYIYPVWVASQTIPLLTQLDHAQTTGEKAGKMLFFSTVGSMLGSTLTPILVFPTLGVQNSTLLMVGVLVACAVVSRFRERRLVDQWPAAAILVAVMLFAFNKPSDQHQFDTSYQTLFIEHAPSKVLLRTGTLYSSELLLPEREPGSAYAREATRIMKRDQNVLMVGAAGFTIAQFLARDENKRITTVDVDGQVKSIAEKHFLQEPLLPNISFHPEGGRYFVQTTQERYDHVLIDAFFGLNVPLELCTVEFFEQLKRISKRTTINVIADGKLQTRYTQRVLKTFKAVFPEATYRDVRNEALTNLMVTSQFEEGYLQVPDFKVQPYTDDNSNADEEILELHPLLESSS